MTDWDLVARFWSEYVLESDDVSYLTRASHDQGVTPISAPLGSVIAHIAASAGAKAIIEVGTGVGVTTMRLAEACPDAHITSIDSEPDHHVTLRELMSEVELDPAKLRLITERAHDVLPKMNENSYDLVLIDVPAADAEVVYQDAVSLCRPGGSILVAGVLAGGEVANPANREPHVSAMRSVLRVVQEDDRVDHALIPTAEGLLWALVHDS